MKIHQAPDFLSTTKGKHILLDTTFFIDAFLHPEAFAELTNQLRSNLCTLVTIKPVLHEFTKGAPNPEKLSEKEEFLGSIIETFLNTDEEIYKNVDSLIKKYGIDGKSTSITDLLLGGTLMKYSTNLLFLTRNTNDYPNRIFTPVSYLHLVHSKGIHLCALYKYE